MRALSGILAASLTALPSAARPAALAADDPPYVVFTLMGPDAMSVQGDGPDSSTVLNERVIREGTQDLRERFGEQKAGQARYIGYSVALVPVLNVPPAQLKAQVNLALDAAQRTGIPVFLHLDDEHFWSRSPELFKDPAMVEWTDFPKEGEKAGPVVPRYWLDWGEPSDVFDAPPPCFECPAFRTAVTARLKDGVAALVARRLREWRAQGKDYLLAGVAVGNETQVPDFRRFALRPGEVKGMDRSVRPARKVSMAKEEMVRIGYHSLSVKGYDRAAIHTRAQEEGLSDDEVMSELLFEVAHDYAQLQAKVFVDAGVPRERVYTHFTSTARSFAPKDPKEAADRLTLQDNPPFAAAVNPYSRPGFTVVHDGADLNDISAQVNGAPWAAVESYSTTGQPGAPQTQEKYEAYLGGLLAHGAKVVNVYGYDIPAGRSPFAVKASGVIPAVKKWLAGAALPAAWSGEPIPEIRGKMARLQTAGRAAVDHGRDPRQVMKTIKRFQAEFEPLMKDGKLAEALAALDRALADLEQGK